MTMQKQPSKKNNYEVIDDVFLRFADDFPLTPDGLHYLGLMIAAEPLKTVVPTPNDTAA